MIIFIRFGPVRTSESFDDVACQAPGWMAGRVQTWLKMIRSILIAPDDATELPNCGGMARMKQLTGFATRSESFVIVSSPNKF
jgi:hypothetical protein